MDKSVQIAIVMLIVVAAAAAFLTRDTGPRAASSAPEAAIDQVQGVSKPGSGEAPAGDERPGGDEEGAEQLPRFVEVGAQSCVPCKMMQPILDELRADHAGRLQVDFADVWANPELGQKYDVQTIPTQVIYDASGREVFRHIGYWPREEIDAKLKELGIIG